MQWGDPIRAGAGALTRQAEQYYSYIFRYETLAAENEALKEKIAQLEDDQRLAASLARENDRLRALLDLTKAHEDYALVDADVIGRSSGDWTSTFTLNRGANHGIEKDMVVITANGAVVGLITEVGSNYAVFKSVLDSSLEISATIASSGYSGMVSGAYTSGRGDLLRMDYLPSSAVIRNNDQIVTTGSTLYPKGLLLGYITNVSQDETGVAKYAALEASCNLDDMEQVFVITDYDNQ